MTTDITNIPLNKLTAWEGNVRKTQTKGGIDELAASIKAHGLLQSLVVKPHGKKFAVAAGGRRLKALQQLAANGDIPPDHPVPCKVTEAGTDASELSLAENVVRENMHPADQFEAFRDLIDKGLPIADVAARFGVTETIVKQRLKLARVSPLVLKAYRDEELTLEDVMAFAVSDDHDAQEHVLSELENRHDAHDIRAALTENDIQATDKRVRYVTLKAYEKAGGTVRRDLFAEDDRGVFILDQALLDRLAAEKLEKASKAIGKEGWKWIETRTDFGYDQKSQFHRMHPELKPLPAEQQAQLDTLQAEYDALDEEWSNADDEAERPERLDEIDERIEQLNDREEFFPDETLRIAGAVLHIGYNGDLDIERGLVRPEDAPKKSGKAKPAPSGTDAAADSSPALSSALTESLTAHRSAAISAEMLQRPGIALAAIVYTLSAKIVLGPLATDSSLEIQAKPQSLKRVEGSKAFTALEEARESWGQQVPGTPDALWTWCLEQHQSVLLDLLAFCTATTINAVQLKADREGNQRLTHAETLASSVNLDMTTWFTPTAENYFSRISKPQILEALREAKGTAPAPAWEKLKKSELAALAVREIEGRNWLPQLLRRT